MTTGNPQRSVLVFGKSQLILDDVVAALRDHGYTAQGTNDFFSDITGQFDVTQIDLVVLGTQVPPDRQAELKEEIGAINPRVIFIQSLAGIPGLIINQVQGAFAADHRDPAQAPTYTPGDHSIRLTLADPADVKVTVFWRTSIVPPDPKSDSLVLLDDRLASGDHTIPVPDHIFSPPQGAVDDPRVQFIPPQSAFATVQVDAAIYAFSIPAEH
jgi:hypothetical protein